MPFVSVTPRISATAPNETNRTRCCPLPSITVAVAPAPWIVTSSVRQSATCVLGCVKPPGKRRVQVTSWVNSYVPAGTWHATRYTGPEPACRLSITEYVGNALLLEPRP